MRKTTGIPSLPSTATIEKKPASIEDVSVGRNRRGDDNKEFCQAVPEEMP
jgi:hypothetical protein